MISTSTTLAPDVEVKAHYLQLADAYWACLRAPDKCDPAATTASAGPARAALTKTLQDLVSGGLFAGTDDPGYVLVESVKLTGPTTAIVSACWWDTGVLYGPPAEAGGPPLVVNNLRPHRATKQRCNLKVGAGWSQKKSASSGSEVRTDVQQRPSCVWNCASDSSSIDIRILCQMGSPVW